MEKIILLLFFLINFGFLNAKILYSDIDEFINTTKLIESKGYPAEDHDIITDDEYIISIQRIPKYSKGSNYESKPVVLLQHGLLDSSACWVINFPSQSLGFILSDAGYDVWLGNIRGNTYGLRHKKFNTSQNEFWDFSWSEMAKYDLNAIVDYILKKTQQKDLIYIGHSQGTLIAFSELSLNQNLVSKIKLFIAMGPVTMLNHIKSPIRYIADMGTYSNQNVWYSLFGRKSFLPSSKMIDWLSDKFCNFELTDRILCVNTLFFLCGPSKYMNRSRISVYITHNPSGTSVKNLAHFAQGVISGKYQMYDYGPNINKIRYNQTNPPVYDLSKVQVPTALYWAKNDWLADPIDVKYIRNTLPNIVDDYEVPDWDHLDFLLAINAKNWLYDRIISLIKKFS